MKHKTSIGMLLCLGILLSIGILALTKQAAASPLNGSVVLPAERRLSAEAQPAYNAGAAAGTTYYVDAATGSDTSGDGSTAHPWRTIQHAAGQVAAGDTVLIQPGIYDGDITVDTSGTAAAPITFRGNGDGVLIEGSGSARDAFFITEADYIILENLRIQHASRAGLRISWSDHVTVRDCVFADNQTWGVFTGFSNYTTVEDSEMYGSVEQHGIYISNSSDYPVIRHNLIHDNYGCGVHMNGDISMGGDGTISYGIVEGNRIYENGEGGGSAINMDGVSDTVVRNNLLYDNHASGISIYQIDGATGSQRNRLLNNTILMPADARWGINIPNSSDTDNRLYNNIVLNADNWKGSILIPGENLSGFESDNNIVSGRFSVDGGDSVIDLAAWQDYGFGSHSFVAGSSALFFDAGAGDYHLKGSSPAIDAGTALPDVPNDLDGNNRPIGLGWDIGSYEFMQALKLAAVPADEAAHLSWTVGTTLPVTSTWQILYTGIPGNPASPISGLNIALRSFTLTGLTNYTRYTVTLNAVLDGAAIMTDTAVVYPSDIFLHLPVVMSGGD